MTLLLASKSRRIGPVKRRALTPFEAALAKRPHKYKARKLVVDNIKFDSKWEAEVWFGLKIRERIGEITGLVRQPRYTIIVNGCKICDYIADAAFTENGKRVAVDAKGVRTQAYILKRKLFLATHADIEHREVYA